MHEHKRTCISRREGEKKGCGKHHRIAPEDGKDDIIAERRKGKGLDLKEDGD